MAAVAISKRDEEQIERLRKELQIRSKSGVIRAALKTLQEKTEEGRLRREIQESVRRCSARDQRENRLLLSGAYTGGRIED